MLETLRKHPLIIPLVLIFIVVLIQTSWIGDDAFITMRTIDNFIHGYGLRWNIAERVQTYTHPLWMFLLTAAYLPTGNAEVTLVGLSILVSSITIFIFLAKIPKTDYGLLLGWGILILSKAFVDYASSGLENPLTHLLLLGFALLYLPERPFSPRKIFMLSLLFGLALFNRIDSALMLLPALIDISLRAATVTKQPALKQDSPVDEGGPRSQKMLARSDMLGNLGLILAGLSPFILWEIFSLVYYGFFLPNTYYAKLSSGVPQAELLAQGLLYFVNSLGWNPLTLTVASASVVLAFAGKDRAGKMLGSGILLYFAYILYIGGDFMSGRFFTGPLLLGVILLIRHIEQRPPLEKFAWAGLVLLLGYFLSPLTAFGNREMSYITSNGIADESAGYYAYTSLVFFSRDASLPTHPNADLGREIRKNGSRLVVQRGVGMLGYFAGPGTHIVDLLGLGDPLLARLPIPAGRDWRIAHFERDLPEGYLATLETGANQIRDPALAEVFDKLHLIVSGDLWTRARWQAIWELNTGKYLDIFSR